jgi:hypothetical protein
MNKPRDCKGFSFGLHDQRQIAERLPEAVITGEVASLVESRSFRGKQRDGVGMTVSEREMLAVESCDNEQSV